MPIPELNEHGLLPAGVHECTLAEAHDRFAHSPLRQRLWDNLELVLAEMAQANLLGVIYLDGSYVTDKPEPADIEVTLDVRQEAIVTQGLACMFYHNHHGRLDRILHIDWYPTLPSENDFTTFFQYLGNKTAIIKGLPASSMKGILKVSIWNTI